MTWRQYDNALGRFHGVDAMASLNIACAGLDYVFGINAAIDDNYDEIDVNPFK